MRGSGEWTTRRYLSLLGNVLIWIIVAIDAWYLWPSQLGGATSMVIVSGVSMEPNYYSGDLVIARKMEPSVGDIIIYAPKGLGGSQIVHRIIGGNAEDGWQMKGDNNNFIDPFTPKGDEVKGVVLVHYPNFGRVTALLLSPIVWALVLLGALVMLLWWSDDCEDDDDEQHDDEQGGDPASGAADTDAAEATAGADPPAAQPQGNPDAQAPVASGAGATQSLGAHVWRKVVTALATVAVVFGAGVSPASASQLTVHASTNVSFVTVSRCAAQTLAATVAGTPSSGTYTSVSVSGIAAACRNLPTTVRLFNAAGTQLASGTATPTAATATFTTGSYSASAVTKVMVEVKGWPFPATWTAPTVPAFSCVGLDASGNPTGAACTASLWKVTSWTTAGYTYLQVGIQADTTAPVWQVTLNLADAGTFPQFPIKWVGAYQNAVLAPGYACSQMPVITVREANPSWNSNQAELAFTNDPGGMNPTVLCTIP